METRTLGAGGPVVSRLGLGLAALGRPAYITVGHDRDFPGGRAPAEMEGQARDVLDAAYAAGVRYFDAARSYGRAEAFLRGWLLARRLGREDVVVGSKWGYRYTGGWRLDPERHEVKDHSAAALREGLAASEAELSPWLALYQIHSATPESGVLDDPEVLDGLAALRDRGVRVGVSVSGVSQAETIRRATAVRRGGAPLFAAVQATWNVLERSCGEALAEAHRGGAGVIVKEALANGRLTVRGDAGASGPVADVARALGATADAVALAAALAQPFADVVLLGASTAPQVASNARALELALSPEALAVLAAAAEPAPVYWAGRARLPWR
ncbi:MAG: aldo/keto reductase [Anaeromyxobacteraceae bacterium]